MAYLSPTPGAPLPSTAFLRRCLEELADRGYHQAVTAALMRSEQAPFLDAGFAVHEELLLFARDLRHLPQPGPLPLRRARAADHGAVLSLDERCFSPFWQLDVAGLHEAMHATPSARFRVATTPDGEVAGYAVTGRAARRGYLQRLAVDGPWQGQGVGRALVVDGLRWLRRWRVRQVVVNTQEDNVAATALYEGLGFRQEPSGLAVLAVCLTP